MAPGAGRAPLTDIVTSDDRRAQYLAAGWWDDATLPAQVAAHAVDPAGRARRRRRATAPTRYATLATAAAGAGGRARRARRGRRRRRVDPAAEPVRGGRRRRGHAVARRGRQPAAAELPGPRARPRVHDGSPGGDLHARRVPRLRPPRPDRRGGRAPRASRRCTSSSATTPGAGGGWRSSRCSAPAAAAPLGSGPADGGQRGDLHLRHRGPAEGDHAHRADRPTSACASPTTTSGSGRDDVVWMPSPIGHSTGFNYGVRFALYHGLPLVLQDRWDGAAAAALVGRAPLLATRWRRPRSCRT